MKPTTPVINLKAPDIEIMNPEDYEEPKMFIVVDESIGVKYCDHLEIRVYPHHRIIKCRKCHKTIDPFDYILSAGQLTTNFISHMKYLKIQMNRLIKEEEELRKTVNKFKRRK